MVKWLNAMSQLDDFFLDSVNVPGREAARRQNRPTILLGNAEHNIASTEIMEIIGKRAQRPHNILRIPAGLELQPFPFDSPGGKKAVNINRKVHAFRFLNLGGGFFELPNLQPVPFKSAWHVNFATSVILPFLLCY